jgi:hypothetical protein
MCHYVISIQNKRNINQLVTIEPEDGSNVAKVLLTSALVGGALSASRIARFILG